MSSTGHVDREKKLPWPQSLQYMSSMCWSFKKQLKTTKKSNYKKRKSFFIIIPQGFPLLTGVFFLGSSPGLRLHTSQGKAEAFCPLHWAVTSHKINSTSDLVLLPSDLQVFISSHAASSHKSLPLLFEDNAFPKPSSSRQLPAHIIPILTPHCCSSSWLPHQPRALYLICQRVTTCSESGRTERKQLQHCVHSTIHSPVLTKSTENRSMDRFAQSLRVAH